MKTRIRREEEEGMRGGYLVEIAHVSPIRHLQNERNGSISFKRITATVQQKQKQASLGLPLMIFYFYSLANELLK